MQIQFEVSGAKQLSRNLRVAVKNLKDVKGFHKEAIEIMEKKSLKIFDKSGLNVEKNPKWRSLANSTMEARAKRRGYYRRSPKNPSTLVWTGNLKESRRKKATNDFGVFEFTAKYAVYHQEGGRNLPKRALIDLDNKTNTEIVKALQKKINNDLKIFGLQQ